MTGFAIGETHGHPHLSPGRRGPEALAERLAKTEGEAHPNAHYRPGRRALEALAERFSRTHGEGHPNTHFSPGRRALAERFAKNHGEPSPAGGDAVSLSPRAQAHAHAHGLEHAGAQGNETGDGESGSDSVDESGKPAVAGEVGGFLHGALNGIKRDLSKLLKGFGFEPDVAKDFAKSFVEPVLAALKEGVSFTAELSYAAFSQVTKQTDNSFSQSTALVAKSLSIEVNNETGEVAVSLASLSFRQEVRAVSLGEAPLLALGPGPILPPREKPQPEAPTLEAPTPEAPTPEEVLGEDSQVLPAPRDEDPLQTLLADLQRKLSLEAVSFQAAIAIRSLEFFENEKGEPITRLEVDAEVPLDGSILDLPEEQRDPLDVTV